MFQVLVPGSKNNELFHFVEDQMVLYLRKGPMVGRVLRTKYQIREEMSAQALGNARLSYEELLTELIESPLNSRPITVRKTAQSGFYQGYASIQFLGVKALTQQDNYPSNVVANWHTIN